MIEWIVNTFLDNFFKVVLPVLYRSLMTPFMQETLP